MIQSYSANHIHTTISDSNAIGKDWNFIGIYGFPEATNKHKTWDLLRIIHQSFQDRWLVCGDFDEIMEHREKWEGKKKVKSLLLDFKATIDHCELIGLGYNGPPFTWCNNREREACISEDWISV